MDVGPAEVKFNYVGLL